MQVVSASASDMSAALNVNNVRFNGGLITVFDPQVLLSSLLMWPHLESVEK